MGYTHFLLKGLEKVRTEWSLITLSYNLKQLLEPGELRKTDAAGRHEGLATVFWAGKRRPLHLTEAITYTNTKTGNLQSGKQTSKAKHFFRTNF